MSESAPSRLTTLLDGLAFPEGPRWRAGRLYFSDMHAQQVIAVDPQGTAEVVATVEHDPSGLGWLPDGRMLVVSMRDRRVLRQEPDGTLTEHANLWEFADYHCNDMVVDRHGRAYVGNFGFDLHAGESPRTTALLRVDPDGSIHIAADDMAFPNGAVITPDGRTLIVGESMGGRITAFSIAGDGSLGERRVFAQLDGVIPDGICLDASGAVWSACPLTGKVVRVGDGGRVLDVIETGHGGAFACWLGGDDRRTLFVCTASTSNPPDCAERRDGRIEAIRVEVPGPG